MKNFKSFISETQGNFAIIAAVTLGMLSFAAAAAIDASGLQSTRLDLQNMSDAASLAAAVAANKNNIEGERINRLAAAEASIAAHAINLNSSVILGEPIIEFDDATQRVSVTIPAERNLFFSGLTNRSSVDVSAISSASYEVADINPVSLAFVVDVSGSMGWCPSQNQSTPCPVNEQPRLETLKEAVELLFAQIETGNDNINDLKDKIRTGVWTYRATAAAARPMADGWQHTINFVNGLSAEGGTHSTDAFESALDALESEVGKVSDPNHKRFIVFMTDGANNDVTSTFETEEFCLDAKEQGISIFSVAFAAPIEGENLLLQCASPNDDEEVSDPGGFVYDNQEERIDIQCDNVTDPEDGESNGRERCERNKEENYFDADNEEDFKEAFAKIGAELGKVETRLTR